ncbi:hypothetical protein PG999_014783 [Apiospora kogelbergensis]|uniref:Uncharacterized protein n=1 Tax=Apiospora kogelbergensis TaxID=1337665 RepID=A0AAW0Q5W0_9PEZI
MRSWKHESSVLAERAVQRRVPVAARARQRVLLLLLTHPLLAHAAGRRGSAGAHTGRSAGSSAGSGGPHARHARCRARPLMLVQERCGRCGGGGGGGRYRRCRAGGNIGRALAGLADSRRLVAVRQHVVTAGSRRTAGAERRDVAGLVAVLALVVVVGVTNMRIVLVACVALGRGKGQTAVAGRRVPVGGSCRGLEAVGGGSHGLLLLLLLLLLSGSGRRSGGDSRRGAVLVVMVVARKSGGAVCGTCTNTGTRKPGAYVGLVIRGARGLGSLVVKRRGRVVLMSSAGHGDLGPVSARATTTQPVVGLASARRNKTIAVRRRRVLVAHLLLSQTKPLELRVGEEPAGLDVLPALVGRGVVGVHIADELVFRIGRVRVLAVQEVVDTGTRGGARASPREVPAGVGVVVAAICREGPVVQGRGGRRVVQGKCALGAGGAFVAGGPMLGAAAAGHGVRDALCRVGDRVVRTGRVPLVARRAGVGGRGVGTRRRGRKRLVGLVLLLRPAAAAVRDGVVEPLRRRGRGAVAARGRAREGALGAAGGVRVAAVADDGVVDAGAARDVGVGAVPGGLHGDFGVARGGDVAVLRRRVLAAAAAGDGVVDARRGHVAVLRRRVLAAAVARHRVVDARRGRQAAPVGLLVVGVRRVALAVADDVVGRGIDAAWRRSGGGGGGGGVVAAAAWSGRLAVVVVVAVGVRFVARVRVVGLAEHAGQGVASGAAVVGVLRGPAAGRVRGHVDVGAVEVVADALVVAAGVAVRLQRAFLDGSLGMGVVIVRQAGRVAGGGVADGVMSDGFGVGLSDIRQTTGHTSVAGCCVATGHPSVAGCGVMKPALLDGLRAGVCNVGQLGGIVTAGKAAGRKVALPHGLGVTSRDIRQSDAGISVLMSTDAALFTANQPSGVRLGSELSLFLTHGRVGGEGARRVAVDVAVGSFRRVAYAQCVSDRVGKAHDYLLQEVGGMEFTEYDIV